MNVITIELSEDDAHRLLWLVQNAAAGKIWDAYWERVANHLKMHIESDTKEVNSNGALQGANQNI
jgi:hypothetical protein